MAAWPPGNWVKHLINNAGLPTFLLHHFLVSTIEYKRIMGDIVCFVSLTLLDQIQVIKLFSSYLTNDQYIRLCSFLKYINLFSNLYSDNCLALTFTE